MNPARLESLVVSSASWMFKRAHSVDFWWNPAVLTPNNPDITAPKLADEDAEAVFEELRKRKLIVSDYFQNPNINNNAPFLAYKINGGKKKEWLALINERGLLAITIKPWALHIWGTKKTAVYATLSALALAFCVKLVQNAADWVLIPPSKEKVYPPASTTQAPSQRGP